MDRFGLADLPIQGSYYAWFSGLVNPPFSKIDGFQVSSEWNELYTSSSDCTLLNVVFDHCPIFTGLREDSRRLETI